MIEMLRIYSKGSSENVTIEELTPWSTIETIIDVITITGVVMLSPFAPFV